MDGVYKFMGQMGNLTWNDQMDAITECKISAYLPLTETLYNMWGMV